jgi:hypothetical protein
LNEKKTNTDETGTKKGAGQIVKFIMDTQRQTGYGSPELLSGDEAS